MTIEKAKLTNSADQQRNLWNKSGVVRATYSTPPGIDWAVIGLVMADTFDPDSHESALKSAVAKLANITRIVDPICYGTTPEEIEGGSDEAILISSSDTRMDVGSGRDLRSRKEVEIGRAGPLPLNKQWLVLNLLLPEAVAPIGTITIEALEAALETVPLVQKAEHLCDGTIRTDASNAKVLLESRIRIEAIPVEEPVDDGQSKSRDTRPRSAGV